MIDCIFRHPYYHSGAVIARLAVSGATLFWALVVLAEPHALEVTRYGYPMTAYVPEDWIATVFAVLSASVIYRTLRHAPPNPWGVIPHLCMTLLWLYAGIMIWATRPWQPTTLSWVTVGVVMAAFALVANPRQSQGATSASGL